MKLFYSWQSDIDGQKNTIEKALSKAIKKVSKEIDIEIALDRDTKNTSGSTEIADEILRKINYASIFVGDITFINTGLLTKLFKSEKYPNPNVLVELGYAVRKIGWDRIIMIFNKKYGDIEKLPFDLRHRRILAFNDMSSELENDFVKAIKDIIKQNKNNKIPNRDIEEYHDIEVFNRLMTDIPEDNLKHLLNWISDNGRCNYDETKFIFTKNHEINLPKNKFINDSIQNSISDFGESVSELATFLSLNFFPSAGNEKIARINQFEGIHDYDKKDDLVSNLLLALGEKTDKVLERFENFRLTVKNNLCI
jgi:hypothetical protein